MEILEEEPPLERKNRLLGFIDALFYPLSISGGIHLAVFLFAPFAVGLISRYVLSGFFILGGVLSLLLYLLYVGYVLYYLAYCIFDSSKGGWRAPDISLQPIPDKGDLVSQLLRVCGCFAVCFWPLAVYYILTERADLVFWLLFVLGSFFLPMALLAGVLFDSFDALNPILIIRSIYKTFLPYCPLVPLFCIIDILVIRVISNLPRPGNYLQVLGYGFLIVDYLCSKSFVYHTFPLFYLAMVSAHFLGRFYWWNKDKLNWGL